MHGWLLLHSHHPDTVLGVGARAALARAYDAAAHTIGLEPPFISHHIVSLITDATFTPINDDDVLDGLSPFLFPDLAPTDSEAAAADA